MAKAKRKIRKTRKKSDKFVLPVEYDMMGDYIKTHKTELQEWVVTSVEYALKYRMDTIELFHFESSKFIVTLNEDEFNSNINHILADYLGSEKYELCPRVVKLKDKLDKIHGE